MTEAERIYENRKYISPKKYDELSDRGFKFESFPFGGGVYQQIIKRITELVNDYEKVFTGYMASSVRGYHDNFIVYKNLKQIES